MTIAKVCKNCGGIVEGSKCKYCGTEYEEMPDNGCEGYLLLGGEKIHGYISQAEYKPIKIESDIYRDRYGIVLCQKTSPPKRTFTFVEL